MKDESIKSYQWIINLNGFQKTLHSFSELIIKVFLPIGIIFYLGVLVYFDFTRFWLYVPLLILVIFVQIKFFTIESYFPMKSGEVLLFKISESGIFYGVSGREIHIKYPIKIKRGLMGCVNLESGPGYYLPIPKSLFEKELIFEKLSEFGWISTSK